MEAIVHTDVAEFAALTRDRYARDPVRNTLAITVLHRNEHLAPSDERLVMVSLHENGRVIGSVLRTPPRPAMLTDLPLDAVDLAVAALREADPDLPGVIGPSDRAEAFAQRWTTDAKVTPATRLYRLGDLEPPDATGAVRMADEQDTELLARWRDEFNVEALAREPRPVSAREQTRRAFELGNGAALWEVDGTPVAWANASRPVLGMSRLAPVYTPPRQRRHGYGAAVSAAVSRWALDQGAEHVVLFADPLNAAANSIYQRIGYREVVVWTQHEW